MNLNYRNRAWFVFIVIAIPAARATPLNIEITIRNHRFEPVEVHVPADTKVKLVIKNLDPTPEEFESYELNREKVIAGNSTGLIFVGPLAPGRYPFFGDFNPKLAQGLLVAE
jgi:hypothetical protein